jgi:hypothetical protein
MDIGRNTKDIESLFALVELNKPFARGEPKRPVIVFIKGTYVGYDLTVWVEVDVFVVGERVSFWIVLN